MSTGNETHTHYYITNIIGQSLPPSLASLPPSDPRSAAAGVVGRDQAVSSDQQD